MTRLNIWHGGLLILPVIGLLAAAYCGIRYKANKSWIALGAGLLFAGLSVWGLIYLLTDK